MQTCLSTVSLSKSAITEITCRMSVLHGLSALRARALKAQKPVWDCLLTWQHKYGKDAAIRHLMKVKGWNFRTAARVIALNQQLEAATYIVDTDYFLVPPATGVEIKQIQEQVQSR